MNIYLDIETIPDQDPEALNNIAINLKPPGNIKKPESIAKWLVEKGPQAAAEQYAKGGLNGISGEVVSIAWALDDGEIDGHIRQPSESEADLLSVFFDNVHLGVTQRVCWVGHNVIDFDLRFIKQRCFVNNIHPPMHIPADAKHGSVVFDTMKAWSGWRGYVSQDALCGAFGIKGKDGMSGEDVWPAYQEGRYEDILEYNKDDVRIVRELHRRMSWG